MTQQNVSDGIKKLGITRKKTYGYQERNEEKRTEFNQKLQEKFPKNLVYVDEAGFDNRDDYQTTVIATTGKDVMHSNLVKEKRELVGLPPLKKQKYSHR